MSRRILYIVLIVVLVSAILGVGVLFFSQPSSYIIVKVWRNGNVCYIKAVPDHGHVDTALIYLIINGYLYKVIKINQSKNFVIAINNIVAYKGRCPKTNSTATPILKQYMGW